MGVAQRGSEATQEEMGQAQRGSEATQGEMGVAQRGSEATQEEMGQAQRGSTPAETRGTNPDPSHATPASRAASSSRILCCTCS